jgi:5-methylcytosine-specific restriction endonuclease McrA
MAYKNVEDRRTYAREYRRKNPDRTREYRRRTYLIQKSRDPDAYNAKATESHNRWVAENNERARQLQRESYERNRAKRLAEKRDYAQSFPDLIAANNKRQRARRKGANLGDAELTYDFIGILSNDPCCYCHAPQEHIDHITPIAHGGSHEWENLTAACKSCNQSKHARSLLTFLLEGRVGNGS